MATRIVIKNSTVGGKVPAAGDLINAELALNLTDKKLYSKDAAGNVFEIGGGTANVPGGGTPPGTGNEIGDLFFDTNLNQLLYWDGSQWVPIAGDEVQDLDDLDDVTIINPQQGDLLVWDGSKWVNSNPGYLTEEEVINILNGLNPDGTDNPGAEEYAKLTDIKDGKLTIKDADDNILGEFTANQEAPTEVIIPAAKWEDIEGNPITIGGTQPGNPSLGDIWIDTSDCPPTLNIWDDCEDPGNPIWTPIGGGGSACTQGPVQITSSNGTNLNSTLTAVGGNGVDDGSSLSATYEWTGAKTGSGSTIVADVEGDYTVTATITCVDGSKLSSTAVWTVVDNYVDMINNTPPVIAVVGAGVDEAYEGNSIYVVTPATVVNGDLPSIVETQWFKNGAADGTGTIYTIGAGDETAVITAKQLFRDLRGEELLSDASNSITIVDRPADAITFDAVITDDGTPEANTPGHVLTASAENIQGGTAAAEYAYEWKVGGLSMGSNKTLNIVYTFVGKTVTCDVTVAEPDGSSSETRTATYGKAIESGLKVGKGVITPSIDVEEGDTLTGSATVTDAAGSFTETHVWELNGSEAQRGTNATYVAEVGTVRYRKEVTDTAKTVIGEWSDPVIVAEAFDPTVPNATMYGLRFDEQRVTALERFHLPSASEDFTYSCWVKRLGGYQPDCCILASHDAGPSRVSSIQLAWNDKVDVYVSGSQVINLNNPVAANTWGHFVFSVSNNIATVYVNGANIGTGDMTGHPFTNGLGLAIGRDFKGGGNRTDGYLSDVYFVDGHALEPEVFGKSFDGRWGPLDSSDVYDNIAGGTGNYDQKWSDAPYWSDTIGYLNTSTTVVFDSDLLY